MKDQSQLILAIDQGTSSTKALLIDEQGKVVYRASEPLHTYYLEEDWVEQDPEEIYQNVLLAISSCLEGFQSEGGNLGGIKACGISNQRETFVLWNKDGKPLYNAVVWQCKRSIEVCARLENEGMASKINQRTGLIIDPYFSGTKVIWLYENNAEVKAAIDQGEAFFGTVDSWLLYKLTKGKSYCTDYTNASRTLFFNLHDLQWDKELLADFGLTKLNLPNVKPSAHAYGVSDLEGLLAHEISIAALIGDSHAAAFGEGCFESGIAKATLGTGCSILMNIGNKPTASENGMITTICWSTAERTDYALEGVIVSAGATIEWLRKQLGLFESTTELESICRSVEDNGGVYLIPAFSGLGSPHWDMKRRASLEGMTFATTKDHVIRAAVESVPYQIKDVIVAMEADSGTSLSTLKIDGGITKNDFVIEFLADLLEREVTQIEMADVSALGASYLAGLQIGWYESMEALKSLHQQARSVLPGPKAQQRQASYQAWQKWITPAKS
ncbi:MAG: glycerol kinase GlpK [Saprospiraceae bacterium]|nr:glycerol kinase GlpK [Saprospiraceae bacterium]